MKIHQHDRQLALEKGAFTMCKLRMIRLGTIVALLIGSVLAIGSALASAGTNPRELVVAPKSDPVSLDPHRGPDNSTYTVINTIHEGLVKRAYNDKGELGIVPGLASSWKRLDDRTMEFSLRKGVKFHSGQELTAEDVKATLERLMDPKQPWPNRDIVIGKIDKVVVVDKYTIRLSASQPYPAMLAGLAIPGMAGIMEAKRIDALKMDYTQNPSGTGPFRLVEKVKGERTVVERFPDYWGPKPAIDRIIFRPITDDAARMIALQTGEVDMATFVPPVQIQPLKNAGLQIKSIPGNRPMLVSLNTLKPPLSDARVRQALNYAVDVDKIASDLFRGATERALSPMAPSLLGYKPNRMYRFDPTKAKQLLAAAGFPNGFEVSLWAPQGRYLLDRELATTIIAYLANVGVRVKLEIMEWATWSSRVAEQTNAVRTGKKKVPDYDMILWGNSAPTLDPDGFLTATYLTGGYWNKSEYTNPRVDELIAKAGTTDDPKSRAESYAEVQDIIMKDAPCIFLTIDPVIVGMSANLKGVTILPMEMYLLDGAHK